ncbi:hypothetical protein EM864_02840 [Stenotrophomonas acidaminiphila]|uniref:hypothetical protein n=1 Tax=Stenotrophomonas acidaminiphila TaxID=128780 RepID=UPI0024063054|nr:hypothetical protein [Stenotrophomonas acidaminiphila]MDF9440688.1 hypothetical protein [Stenotrophomonas acidaminiphila]
MTGTPSHGHLRPDPVSLRDPCDFLFEADGQRGPLLQALYTESLVNRRDVDAIDSVLDAHRLAYGEPEQVAYAQQRDGLHDRPLPLVSSDGGVGDVGLQRYLEEHRAWNPVTQREREFCLQAEGVDA